MQIQSCQISTAGTQRTSVDGFVEGVISSSDGPGILIARPGLTATLTAREFPHTATIRKLRGERLQVWQPGLFERDVSRWN